MRILAIETSCDETSAAIVVNGTKLLSNIVASSVTLHGKTGGIVPEVAAREQVRYIIPVMKKALTSSIDAIAVTIGPGLIGSLLVGVETAKTLAYVWDKPIVPVNHLIGHIYANWVKQTTARTFPAIALVVSGGHTDLVLMKGHGRITWLGGTRDDAAGEAFDKIGRLLGLPYPGGPAIEKASERAPHPDGTGFTFPRPMIDSDDFDFSFSGLKTAVLREVKVRNLTMNHEPSTINDLAASVQQAVIDVLVAKTLKAAQKFNVKSILLSGGVAANETLREQLKSSIIDNTLSIKFFVPPKNLCSDNAAMIASAAFFNYHPIPWQRITADPELSFA